MESCSVKCQTGDFFLKIKNNIQNTTHKSFTYLFKLFINRSPLPVTETEEKEAEMS